MSDIRFNRWLHQSGTGGISQDANGNIGIGTTVPLMALDVRGDVNIGDTININNASGIISATTFTGTTGTFSGNMSVTGNVSIAGTLTYEDVSNIDAVGIITAQSDIIVGGGLSVTGISTFNNDVKLLDNDKLKFGIGEDLQIYHDPASGQSKIVESGSSVLKIQGSDLRLSNTANTKDYLQANDGAAVKLFYNGGAAKFETTNTGAVVTGILTATTFSGNLTGNVTGDLTGNLTGISSIAAISSSISDTAVDVFVYDTTKDSDGGAWRKRTQNTSWYNETLNTSVRGSRKEFPAVAVIVMQEGTLTIYDGDDPDLPMWMVFTDNNDTGSQFASAKMLSCRTATSIFMLNGMLMCGGKGAYHDGATELNFLSDSAKKHMNNGYYYSTLNISQRETTGGYYTVTSGTPNIVSNLINDVAMTVLPNAPIDSATGLPIPTIAVATNGGLSIIKDDGTVSSPLSGTQIGSTIDISDDFVLYYGNESQGGYYPYDVKTATFIGNARFFSLSIDGPLCLLNNISNSTNQDIAFTGDDGQSLAIGMDDGLNLINGDPRNGIADNGMVAYATTSYNTGWMHGDIKGAFLSDTTNVTETELIINGTFDSDISGWTDNSGSGSSISWSSGTIYLDGAAANAKADQQITTVPGKTYVVSAEVSGQSGSETSQIWVGTAVGSWSLGYTISSAAYNGVMTKLFTATTTTTWIRLYTGGNTYFDNVSVRLADQDRSVNNNGLQVLGTITKTPVATGADLVAYSGFSTSNYLQQPYNSGLNFGTGDFYVMGWAKPTNNIAGYVWERAQHQTASGYTEMFYHTSGQFRFYINGAGNVQGAVPLNIWSHFVCLRQSGVMYMFINGVRQSTTAGNSGSLNNTSAKLRIGIRAYDIISPFYGEISLIRTGGGAPSPEQIKKIYDDERWLFQENAKCTLYGSSDAVTALAYDDTTNLLHVGTSAGRSEFQGLRRINNTTDAVTTAISASNGLVAEQ